MPAHYRVVLRGNPPIKSAPCTDACFPGDLLEGDAQGRLHLHPLRGGSAGRRLFAVENDMGGGIDTAWMAGDTVNYVVARPGDEINARVAPYARAIAANDLLVSAGDGTLEWDNRQQSLVDGPLDEQPGYDIPAGKSVGNIGRALEAVDNSAGAAASRLRIEVSE